MFAAGDLVYCIGGTAGEADYALLNRFKPEACPKVGLVYFVARVDPSCPQCGSPHLELEELGGVFVNGYPARWFRPCAPVDFDRFMRRIFDQQERPFA